MTDALRNSGVNAQFVNVQVAAETVSLWGATNSDVERKAIILAAETAPGVKRVDSYLGVLSPMVRASMGSE